MNIIDKAIEMVAPVHAVKRMAARKTLKIFNTGYSDGGASHSKNSLKGFTARSSSPLHDIDANLNTLKSRSRSLYMTSPIATSSIKTIKTNVIGSGLKLKSRIDYEILGLTEEESEKIEEQIEREFALWADTSMCDALGLNNFYEMQSLFFMGQLLNGDAFCIRKYEKPTPFMPYGLRLHLIESDRVCTPYATGVTVGNSVYGSFATNDANGNEIYSGVEIDKNGKVVAYHVCNQYPHAQLVGNYTAPEWARIPTYGKHTGLRNILHMFEAERAEQRRGVPILAPVIESLKQITRYTDAELMAAVISGMYTIFIRTESPTDMPFGEAMPEDLEPIEKGDNDYEIGNGTINVLGTNESIQIADPKRPIAGFSQFVTALCKQIGSAIEVPYELLLKEFNSSYSASKGALLEAWKMFRMRREHTANKFCQPVFEMFMTEAVASGRIKAPKFFADPIIRKAWCGASWNGPAPGMLDPVKEVQAAKLRVDEGFSTREEETMGMTGGNYRQNSKQLQKENKMLSEAKEPLIQQKQQQTVKPPANNKEQKPKEKEGEKSNAKHS